MKAEEHTAEVKVFPLVNSYWLFEGSPWDLVWKRGHVCIIVFVSHMAGDHHNVNTSFS